MRDDFLLLCVLGVDLLRIGRSDDGIELSNRAAHLDTLPEIDKALELLLADVKVFNTRDLFLKHIDKQLPLLGLCLDNIDVVAK